MAPLIFLVVMLLVTYFAMIRPQKARMARHAKLVSEIGVGDRVVTSSGVIGEILAMDDDEVVLRSEGSTLRLVRPAISARVEDVIDLENELGADADIDDESIGDDITGEESETDKDN